MTGWSRLDIARRAALDIPDGSVVNLGIGQPEQIANFVPDDREIILHSENGILGMGPAPEPGEENPNLINAGKKPVTLVPGGAYFHHADSFSMIRGGHIDICVLGAFEVGCNGDIANWSTGKAGSPAVGGAMDLVAGARDVRVIMAHCSRNGEAKLREGLSLPATGRGVVSRIYTDLAVLAPAGDHFTVIEMAPDIDTETIVKSTRAPVRFDLLFNQELLHG